MSEVLQFALFTYAMVAIFVVQSVSRNAREARMGPTILTWTAYGLMSFSAALFVMLAGLVAAVGLGLTQPPLV
ncbi:hypothetical protein [Sphingomonas sp. ID0503]|uniref:hypothetical protein n=1 Tax=Sphingomonas sp. ID0503 TaxID=3399691 RepID=UPI003AFB644E